MALLCFISHSLLNAHVTFYHLPLLFKKGGAKEEGFQRDGGGVKYCICVGSSDRGVGRAARSHPGEVSYCLVASKEACLALFGMWLWGS